MTRTYHRVLSIAGSDSSGGAGIQADLKTISALGCYATTVITALTSQNTTGVTAIQAVTPDFFRAQLTAVLDDIGTDAVKIGMLFSADTIDILCEILDAYPLRNVILDPVMTSQSGSRLLEDNAVHALKISLLPRVDVLMPNLPEAELLLQRRIQGEEEIKKAALDLSEMGCPNIILKGGHLRKSPADWLYMGQSDRYVRFPGNRVKTVNDHGTGCTLSSAVASYLAKGEGLETALEKAKQYVTEALEGGAVYRFGSGRGPLHHFYRYW